MRALNDYLDRLDHAAPPVPAGRRILAALGPRKLELARDRSAGAVPLLVTPAYTTYARGILGEESTLIISQMIILDTDASLARETARTPLRFLSGVRGYRANFARMGFTGSDITSLSDRLVDELVTWGGGPAGPAGPLSASPPVTTGRAGICHPGRQRPGRPRGRARA